MANCVSAGIEYSLLGFKNSWVINWDKRQDSAGYVVVDTRITKDIIRKGNLKFEAFLELTNLFNISYSEQSGIPMPGRWLKSGGRIEF